MKRICPKCKKKIGCIKMGSISVIFINCDECFFDKCELEEEVFVYDEYHHDC